MSEEIVQQKTLVCIFAVLSGEKTDSRIFDRLEEHYLTNSEREGNVLFAVFADLPDGKKRTSDGDEKLLSYAQARIRALSETYGEGFSLFVRNRRRSESEDLYIGKERERGARLELCRFLRGISSGFALKYCEESNLCDVKYLLALDIGARLPIGSACKLAEIASRAENKPVMDEASHFVADGHAMLKLAEKSSFSSSDATPFSTLMKRTSLLYTPKLLDVDVFLAVCDGFFPKERLLDADIIEDFLLRAKTVSDIILPCQTVKTAVADYTERYLRMSSDLQMLPYLGSRIQNEKGEQMENPLSHDAKQKILFRLICHAVPFFVVLVMFSGALFLGTPILFASLTVCFLFSIWKTKNIKLTIWYLSMLAYDAYLFADVSIRTLYRFFVSGKHFLRREENREQHIYLDDHILRFLPSMMLGILFFCMCGVLGKMLGIFWILLPFVLFLLSKEYRKIPRLCARDSKTLMRYTRDAWLFFREEVNEETHGLPPDVIQISPDCEPLSCASPSGIGLYLVSLLSAGDLGLITSAELAKRSHETVETLETLFKWNGHLYCHYDLESLVPLEDAFISTAENGIFAACLITFCEGAEEYVSELPCLSETIGRLTALLKEIDFSSLYDETKKRFYVGYDSSKGEYTTAYEELFMSPARLASLYAIATRNIPYEHMKKLSRYRIGTCGIASEKGTAEECFLSSLFFSSTACSAISKALTAAYRAQKKQIVKRTLFGKKYRLFGRTTSGYFAFDGAMRYRSKEFGIAKTALCPNQNEDVIAPYASFLMLPFSPEHNIENLEKLEALGLYGKYGFYEALDLEPSRVGKGYAKIQAYSAKHLGMSIVSATNVLQDGIMQKRLMHHPAIRAVNGSSDDLTRRDFSSRPKTCPIKREEMPIALPKEIPFEKYAYTLLHPEMAMLSNNKTKILASSSGHIAVENGKISLFRSSFDRYTLGDEFHIYVKIDGILFPTVPLLKTAKEFSSQFSFHPKADMIVYHSHHTNGKKRYDIELRYSVFPDRELCEIACEIKGTFERASARICFFPKTESTYCIDEQVFLFSIDRRYYVGAHLSPYHRDETSFDGILESDAVDMKKSKIILRIAMNEDVDDLLYDLTSVDTQSKRQYLTDNLLNLQYLAAGFSERLFPLERFLLRSFIFGQIRPRTEMFRSIDGTVFSRYLISRERPIVLAKICADGPQIRSHLRELLGLFKFMCIRGMRYDLVICYREREWILSELRLAGCEYFLSWSCGIFLIEEYSLTPHERFSLEITSAALIDLSYSLHRLASENARAISLSAEAEACLKREPETRCLSSEMPQDIKGILMQKEHETSCTMHILSSENCGTILSDRSLGFTFVRCAEMMNLTPPVSEIRKESGGEHLILRLYDQNCTRYYRDYDLCAVSAWTERDASSVIYHGMAQGVRFSVAVRLLGKEPVKYIRMTVESEEAVRAALILSVLPVIGEARAERRFYRFRKTGEGIRILRIADEKNERGELAVFSSDTSVLYTDSAALRSDGKIFLGESDIAAVVSRMELCGKKSICFYLAAVFSEKQYHSFRERLFRHGAVANGNVLFQMLDARYYARGGFERFQRMFDTRFRLQDALVYLEISPEVTKRILYCTAAHQYEEGDLQKWYHPTGAGMRGKHYEDALWFVFVASSYVLRTQDLVFLKAKICYLSSPYLAKEEYERYEIPLASNDRGSLSDHLRRALRYAKAMIPFADIGQLLFFLQTLEQMETLFEFLGKDVSEYRDLKIELLKKLSF